MRQLQTKREEMIPHVMVAETRRPEQIIGIALPSSRMIHGKSIMKCVIWKRIWHGEVLPGPCQNGSRDAVHPAVSMFDQLLDASWECAGRDAGSAEGHREGGGGNMRELEIRARLLTCSIYTLRFAR